jgi:3-oxoacyl-(acyl-carrier-protein) synthase III
MRLQTLPRGHSRLLGVGAYRPRREVTNREIGELVGTPEEWTEARSGIRGRRFAEDDETLLKMATAAGRQALEHSGVPVSALDQVIVATCSNQVHVPALANAVAAELGAPAASGFDLNAACAGFCYALSVASDRISLGQAGYALVIGAERMRDIVDPHDRGTSFLFADGAAGVVVGPSDVPEIGPTVQGSSADAVNAVRMSSLWADYESGPPAVEPKLMMNGKRVFRWAMTHVVPAARRAIEAAGLTPGDLAAFVPHQANRRMIDIIADALGLAPDVVVAEDVRYSGNTSAASVPLALRRLIDEGNVKSGAPTLLMGYGAGLTYCGQVVLLP